MIYFKFKKGIIHNQEYLSNQEKESKETKSTFKDYFMMIPIFFLIIIGLIVELFEKIFSINQYLIDDVDSVDTWYIEFDDQEYNVAIREVGLDKDGRYAVVAPYKDYLGFWCDEDFGFDFYNTIVGVEEISKEEFEQVWNAFSEDNTTNSKKHKKKR